MYIPRKINGLLIHLEQSVPCIYLICLKSSWIQDNYKQLIVLWIEVKYFCVFSIFLELLSTNKISQYIEHYYAGNESVVRVIVFIAESSQAIRNITRSFV